MIMVAASVCLFIYLDFDDYLDPRDELKNVTGRLIVLEGMEGSGKAAMASLMKQYLPAKWNFSKEPYSSPNTGRWSAAEYFEDRRHHLIAKILPNLLADKTLVTNRYWMSACVYDQETPEAYLESWVRPSLVIWLDIDPTQITLEAPKRPLAELQSIRVRYAQLFQHLSDVEGLKVCRVDMTGKKPEDAFLEILGVLGACVPEDRGLIEELRGLLSPELVKQG